MKSVSIAILSTSLAFQAANANDDYTNFIVQTENVSAQDIANGVTPATRTFANVDPSGTAVADPLTANGATFRLYSIHNETNIETEVASTEATTYLPEASIEIFTADPYNIDGVKRTRADKDFVVVRNISGLLAGDQGVEEAATAVNEQREFEYHPDARSQTSISPIALHHEQNGQFPANPTDADAISSELSPQDIFAAYGTETFTIETLEAFGGVGNTELAKKELKVFPVPTATISDFDETIEYNRLPDLAIEYKELYPNSHTSIRFVRDGDSLTIDGLFPKTVEIEPGEVGNSTFVAANLDTHITEAGTYQMQIIHTSPFSSVGEILAEKTIIKKVDVKINANIGTSE